MFNSSAPDIFGGFGDADFDIQTTPALFHVLKDLDNIDTCFTDKYVTYRTDTNACLGIHSVRHKAVAPKDVIKTAREIILRSGLNTEGISEQIAVSHDGARSFVKYKLPAHTYETPDGDNASLGLLATTSIDSSFPFVISAAAIQAACTNLQVFISGEVAVFKGNHTTNLDLDKASRTIVKSLDFFEAERDVWKEMYSNSIEPETAVKMFADIVGVGEQVNELFQEGYSPYNIGNHLKRYNTGFNYLVNCYRNIYCPRLGNTEWAAYNAVTDYTTHADNVRNKNTLASVQFKRQQDSIATLRKYLKAA
jgi:hypothetical protein